MGRTLHRRAHTAMSCKLSGFDRYKPEEEKQVHKVEVKEDEVLKQLKAAWKKFRIKGNKLRMVYKTGLKQMEGLECSSKDIEKFSLALVEFQNEKGFSDKAGVFLSLLINNCKDDDYVIHTQHLTRDIEALGCRNTKNITVYGKVGLGLGPEMEGGSITVNGNAGDYVGLKMKGGTITVNGDVGRGIGQDMKGGSITVHGNAQDSVGERMKGGSITVNGNARDFVGRFMAGGSITMKGSVMWMVGDRMKGGEIHLEGDYEDILDNISDYAEGGKIYHKGKLIVDK